MTQEKSQRKVVRINGKGQPAVITANKESLRVWCSLDSLSTSAAGLFGGIALCANFEWRGSHRKSLKRSWS